MISRQDVVYAYRLLLGREPESEAAVAHYATEVASVGMLRELFINSLEFRSSAAKVLAPRAPKSAVNGAPMVVDLTAPPDKLAALFAKVGAQWHHLGETEPHWSVITNESYFQDKFHTNSAAFFASGESELDMFDATLARVGVSTSDFETCIELGCGVGRATGPLAQRFRTVVGVDISAAHLNVARAHLLGKGLTNVSLWRLATIADVHALGSFDVLYSRIVLQHNPPPVMARLLTDLLSQLRPGGIAFFQVPTYKAGYRFLVDEYLAEENDSAMEMHYFPQAALLGLVAQQQCRVLEIREDDAIGLSLQAVSNTILLQKHG